MFSTVPSTASYQAGDDNEISISAKVQYQPTK